MNNNNPKILGSVGELDLEKTLFWFSASIEVLEIREQCRLQRERLGLEREIMIVHAFIPTNNVIIKN